MSQSNSTNYRQRINSDNPGLIVLLLDQSASMEDKFSEHTKSVAAARAVNRVIYTIVASSKDGDELRNRCFVGVIGYGGAYGKDVGAIVGGFVAALDSMIIGRDDENMPEWVKPKHDGSTPMAEALNQAYPLISDWIKKRPNGFPPIIVTGRAK